MKHEEYFSPDNWDRPDNIEVYVTTKKSFGIKCSSLSYTDGNNTIDVRNNRESLSNELLPCKIRWIKQVHGNKVINFDTDNTSYIGDGALTYKKDATCCVLTADCMPIVVTDNNGSFVSVLHVGRKGLQLRIIESLFEKINNTRSIYIAWIGPSISEKYYIVDDLIRENFININKEYGQFFSPNGDNSYCMSLQDLAEYQLKNLGVNKVFKSGLCTYNSPDFFYSYRRTKTHERFGTFAWIR